MTSFRIQNIVSRFRDGEDGAITVDWVVLTAALTFMGVGAAFFVNSSVPLVADRISSYMSNVEPGE